MKNRQTDRQTDRKAGFSDPCVYSGSAYLLDSNPEIQGVYHVSWSWYISAPTFTAETGASSVSQSWPMKAGFRAKIKQVGDCQGVYNVSPQIG